jgi:hypothetical protein
MSSVAKAKKGGGLMGRASFVAQGLCAGLVLLLAACVGDSSAPDPGLTVSPASLSFTAAQNGAAPPSQEIQISISREDAAFIGVGNPPSVTPPDWFDQATSRLHGAGNNWGFTAAILSTSLAPGVYTTTVRIVIADVDQNILAFRDVQVSYTIQPAGISAAPPSLIFSQAEGGPLPAAQAVALSELGNASYAWNALALYSQESGWLGVNGSQAASGPSLPSSISVGITTPQRLGTHSAAVRITGNGNMTEIPISYVVRKALLPSPTSLSYTIGNTPLPADMTRQISVGAFPGVTWTATSSATWLTLSPASGGSGDSLSASLVQAEVDAKNNGRSTATITLTPSVGSVETIPVTLTVARTQVNYVAPYIAIANTQNEVVIRGDNLDQVTITNVKFGTTAAPSFNLLSGTEIRAIHPSLAPGTYAVRLETNLGVARSLANDLVAVAAPTYAAATIAYPNAAGKQPLDIIYDAERQALLVGVAYPAPGSSGDIFRYPFTGSTWATTPASVSVTNFRDFALSLDGQQVIALTDFAAQQIGATALTTGVTTPAVLFQVGLFFKGLAVANDGNAVLSSGFTRGGASPIWSYSVRDPKITLISSISLVFGTPGASADGSRVVLTEGDPQFPNLNIAQYNSANSSLSFVNFSVAQNGVRPKLDRKASRILLNGYIVLDSDYHVVGNLPEVALGTTAAVALSPDGTRAHQYVSGTVVHTYDLTVAPVGATFPEIGGGTTLPSDPGANPVMTVSPDGGTLFIAGADGIVVVPAP